jgi:hypothetical protein
MTNFPKWWWFIYINPLRCLIRYSKDKSMIQSFTSWDILRLTFEHQDQWSDFLIDYYIKISVSTINFFLQIKLISLAAF